MHCGKYTGFMGEMCSFTLYLDGTLHLHQPGRERESGREWEGAFVSVFVSSVCLCVTAYKICNKCVPLLTLNDHMKQMWWIASITLPFLGFSSVFLNFSLLWRNSRLRSGPLTDVFLQKRTLLRNATSIKGTRELAHIWDQKHSSVPSSLPLWGGGGQINNCYILAHKHACMQTHHMTETCGYGLLTICLHIVCVLVSYYQSIFGRFAFERHYMGSLHLKCHVRHHLIDMFRTLSLSVFAVMLSLWLHSLCCDMRGSHVFCCKVCFHGLWWIELHDPHMLQATWFVGVSHVELAGVSHCVRYLAFSHVSQVASRLLTYDTKGTSAGHLWHTHTARALFLFQFIHCCILIWIHSQLCHLVANAGNTELWSLWHSLQERLFIKFYCTEMLFLHV